MLHNWFCKGRQYILEKQDDPGVPIDMEATLESMGTFEFRLLREGNPLLSSPSINKLTFKAIKQQKGLFMSVKCHSDLWHMTCHTDLWPMTCHTDLWPATWHTDLWLMTCHTGFSPMTWHTDFWPMTWHTDLWTMNCHTDLWPMTYHTDLWPIKTFVFICYVCDCNKLMRKRSVVSKYS